LLQDYENVSVQIKIQIEKKLNHQKYSPENPDKWLKFWNFKLKEMFREGKDLETYDLNPEWTSEPYSRNSSSSSPLFSYSVKYKNSIKDLKNSCHKKVPVKLENNDSDMINKPFYNTNSIFSGTFPTNIDSDVSFSEINNQNKPKEKMNVENPLNVVNVLMQLIALKNQLGSLKPKLIDLLIEGLEMEKIELASSIKLLTPDNCVMFGKIKEKLKIQLLSHGVKKSSMNATKFAVCNIEKMMQLAPKCIDISTISSSESTQTSASFTERKDITTGGLKLSQKINQTLLTPGKFDKMLNEFGTLIKRIKEKDQLNIVDVLRPLVVLENQLGQLAPKTIDLLINSLEMKKRKLESFSDILIPDICGVFNTLDVIPFENFKENMSADFLKSRLKNASTLTVRYMVKLTQLSSGFTPTSSMLNSECTSKPISFVVSFHFHPSQSSSPNPFLTVKKQLNNNYNISPEFSLENYNLKEQCGKHNYFEDQPNLQEQLDSYSTYQVNSYSDFHSKLFNNIDDDQGLLQGSDYCNQQSFLESTCFCSERCSKKKKTHKGPSNTLYYEKYHGTP